MSYTQMVILLFIFSLIPFVISRPDKILEVNFLIDGFLEK